MNLTTDVEPIFFISAGFENSMVVENIADHKYCINSVGATYCSDDGDSDIVACNDPVDKNDKTDGVQI